MAVKCSAIARSGSRCNSPVLPDQAFCWVHSPDAAEARREASRKGGKNRSAQARAQKLLPDAMTTDELAGWLSVAFKQTLSGRLDPKVGSAVATLARALLEAQSAAAQPAIEDLQEQLAVLRQMVQRGQAA